MHVRQQIPPIFIESGKKKGEGLHLLKERRLGKGKKRRTSSVEGKRK
jgi:hypothetical protein